MNSRWLVQSRNPTSALDRPRACGVSLLSKRNVVHYRVRKRVVMRIVTSLLCLLLFGIHPAIQGQRPVLKPVSLDGKWGYADESGRIVIRHQFEEVGPFSDGLAAVAIGTDPNAKSFISGHSKEGFYHIQLIREDLRWGYIDESGEFIIQPQFNYGFPFSGGLAGVRVGRKLGYINKSGRLVIKPRFFDGTEFFGDRAWVSMGEFRLVGKPNPNFSLEGMKFYGRYGYVDRRGKFTRTSFKEWYNARWTNSAQVVGISLTNLRHPFAGGFGSEDELDK